MHSLHGNTIDVIISKNRLCTIDFTHFAKMTPAPLFFFSFFFALLFKISCVEQKLPVVVEVLSKYSH